MPQATRIPKAEWEAQKARITELYINQDKTLDEVIQIMTQSGFHATKPQYIRKVNVNWKLQKNFTKEKWEQASAMVSKREAVGKLSQLSIDGQVIPEKKKRKELKRYHVSQQEQQLTHSSASTAVVAYTPPSLEPRVIILTTLPWFNLRSSISHMVFGHASQLEISQSMQPLAVQPGASLLIPDGLLRADKTAENAFLHGALSSSSDWTIQEEFHRMKKTIDVMVPIHLSQCTSPELQEPLWLQLFKSLVFLATNNMIEEPHVTDEFLDLTLSNGLLGELEHIFIITGPTVEIFAAYILFSAIRVQSKDGHRLLSFLLSHGVSPNSVDPFKRDWPVLLTAIEKSDRAAVEVLLSSGADPNVPSGRFHPLIMAFNQVKYGDCGRAIAEKLIEAGADPSCGYMKSLVQAISSGDATSSHQILEDVVESFDHQRYISALHYAIWLSDLALIDMLIEAGASPNYSTEILPKVVENSPELSDSDIAGFQVLTPLQLAARNGEVEIVKRLIGGGATVDTFVDPDMLLETAIHDWVDDSKHTPLQISAQESNEEIAQVLLDAGANVDRRHPTTSTPLQLACGLPTSHQAKQKLVQVLLLRGADVNALPGYFEGRTALQAAAEVGDCGLFKLLLSKDANISAPAAKEDGLTVLQAAAKSDSIDLFNFVLSELGHLGPGVLLYQTPNCVELAASFGDMQVVENCMGLWTARGLNCPGAYIISALKAAIKIGSAGLIVRLLVAGSQADLHKEACSIICEAIWKGNTKIFDLLMDGLGTFCLDSPLPGDPTPLWLASHECNDYMARRLIEFGADSNQQSPHVCRKFCGQPRDELETPMKQAIFHGNVALAEMLVDMGTDVRCLVDNHRTPLLLALDHRRWEVAEFLLLKGADPNVEDDKNKITALGYAIQWNSAPLRLLQSLIKHGADVNMHSWGRSLIKIAAVSNRGEGNLVQVSRILLEAGTNVSDLSAALPTAIDHKKRDLAKFFIDTGADINASAFGTWGKTALQAASSVGDLELVKYLIGRGANVDAEPARGYGATALQFAVCSGRIDIVKILADHGASINAEASPKFTGTDRHLDPTSMALTGTAESLFQDGTSINAEISVEHGTTALQIAASRGDAQIVTYLVENGASVNTEPASYFGATALQYAAIEGNIKMAVFLLEHGARVDAPAAPIEGRTALEGAAEHGRLDMIYLLLEHDESPETIEERCKDAAKFAETENHTVIARLLREYKRP